MQTAPTSPSNRTANDGSTVKIRNNKEVEYRSFIKEEKKVRKNSIHSKRPNSQHNKAKISIKKNNPSPGNSKLGSHPKIEHKRMSSNFPQSFYVTPSAKFGGKGNETFLLAKAMNGTFLENPRNKRNTSGLAPSKTQQERYKIYNSGRGSNTGPIKVGVMNTNTGNGSWRAVNMFIPNKTWDLNRTQDIRTGSRTGRKIKIVNGNVRKEPRTKPKIVNYKNLVPNEAQVAKEEIKQKTISIENEESEEEIEKKTENISKDIPK